jgi:dUTP pyrophosphatase
MSDLSEIYTNVEDALNKVLLLNDSDSDISQKLNNHATLYLYVKSENSELVELYKKHVKKHNENIMSDEYPNSGFDLFIPRDTVFEKEFESVFVDLEVKCEMTYREKHNSNETAAYYVYPRSSISKTPLMLANHTGIIDSGYRGFLIAALRYLKLHNEDNYAISKYTVEKHTRLLQICHPSLCPIVVKLVDENELSNTKRGEGRFGSTGKVGVSN